MNIFTKKSFMKKIAILCLFLVIFNFTGMSQVQAANNDSSWGGKLLGSVISLFVAIADSAYSLANKCIMGTSYGDSLIDVTTVAGFWKTVAIVVIAVVRRCCRNIYRFINSRTNSSRSIISCWILGFKPWKTARQWRGNIRS